MVTDGEQRAALAVVRSLGRIGHEVFVCATRSRSLAGASRYARGETAVPDPLRDAAGFIAGVRGLIHARRIDTLVPISEASLLAILPERDAFPDTRIPFPAHQTFARICDKPAVLAAARSLGINVPFQRRLDSPEDREGLAGADAGEEFRFPLVLKPARSIIDARSGRTKSSVVHVADADALRTALDGMPAGAYPLLAQERVDGPGVGVFLLVWGGRILAAFAHRRLREKPPSGGVSVFRESIPLDPVLLENSHALLRHFGWRGVAMVEYKLDARTGTPYLMEINGRFWGSLQLAIDAGVDFPALLLAAAADESPETVVSYREGVRTRWFWGDVDHLIARLRRSRTELSLPPDAPGPGRTVAAFLRACGPGSLNEILRFGDPRPAVRETLDWFRGR